MVASDHPAQLALVCLWRPVCLYVGRPPLPVQLPPHPGPFCVGLVCSFVWHERNCPCRSFVDPFLIVKPWEIGLVTKIMCACNILLFFYETYASPHWWILIASCAIPVPSGDVWTKAFSMEDSGQQYLQMTPPYSFTTPVYELATPSNAALNLVSNRSNPLVCFVLCRLHFLVEHTQIIILLVLRYYQETGNLSGIKQKPSLKVEAETLAVAHIAMSKSKTGHTILTAAILPFPSHSQQSPPPWFICELLLCLYSVLFPKLLKQDC